MISGTEKNHLRQRSDGEEAKVDFVELFFDLVFVFAITQLSHSLLHDMSASGLMRAVILLLAVWWVWVFTAWCTNWLDPAHTPVRLLLFSLMLAGLFLTTSIPDAFGERGMVFVLAYVVMQLGRSLFMLWALHRHSRANFRNFQRIFIWLAVSAVFWIAGAAIEDSTARLCFWLFALVIEYISPAMGFRVPGMGASTTVDWDIEGGHLAERCGLFVIIALGESILVAGETFADSEWTFAAVAAFLSTFVGTLAMWWIYFNIGAGYASRRIAESDDPGRIGRAAYTYLPIVGIAGIIVVAVGDELLLAHAAGHGSLATMLAIVGGAALYVFGNALFKGFIFGRWPLSHLAGLGLFAVLGFASVELSPLAASIAATAILVIVAAWEFLSLRSSRS